MSKRSFLRPLLACLLSGGWTLPACCIEGSKSDAEEQAAPFAPFVLSALPSTARAVDARFGEHVHLVGIEAPREAFAGGPLVVTLYWQVTGRQVGGWALFTHVLDEQGERLANGDSSGALREGRGGRAPLGPSLWKPGPIYKDVVEVRLPEHGGGRVRVVAGIWRNEERLPITVAGRAADPVHAGTVLTADGERRLLVAEVDVVSRARQAQEIELPELAVPRLTGAPLVIDGKLDEPAWRSAATTAAFVDVGSGRPAPLADPTGHARVLWDDTSLYFGFTVQSSRLEGGFPQGARDPHVWEHECVEIMIDPEGDGDGRDYYELQISPQNLVFDSHFDTYNAPRGGPSGPFGHEEWSFGGKSAVTLSGTIDDDTDTDTGYAVEVAVPFRRLGLAQPAAGRSLRVNFYAMKHNGGVAWSPILGQGNFHRASRFGRVTLK